MRLRAFILLLLPLGCAPDAATGADAGTPGNGSNGSGAVHASGFSARLLRWPSGARAAFSISTDDGPIATVLTRHAVYYGDPRLLPTPDDPTTWGAQLRDVALPTTLLELGQHYEVPFTHYVDTRQVDEPPDHLPSNPAPSSAATNYGYWPGGSQGPGIAGSWDQWAQVAAAGHEIGSHTVHHPLGGAQEQHPDAPRWVAGVYAAPKHAWLPAEPSWWRAYLEAREGGTPRSFSAPSDELTVSRWRIESELRARAALYPALADYHVDSLSWPRGRDDAAAAARSVYVSSRIVGGGLVDGDQGPKDWQRLPCTRTSLVPAENAADVDEAIARGGWLHKYMHGLEQVYCCLMPTAVLEALLAHVQRRAQEGTLWVATVGEVSRYLRERLDANLTLDVAAERSGRIALTLRLRTFERHVLADRLRLPLEVELQLPASWPVDDVALEGGELRSPLGTDRMIVAIAPGETITLRRGRSDTSRP